MADGRASLSGSVVDGSPCPESHAIVVNTDTLKLFNSFKEKSGFQSDGAFLNYLISSTAAKLQDSNQNSESGGHNLELPEVPAAVVSYLSSPEFKQLRSRSAVSNSDPVYQNSGAQEQNAEVSKISVGEAMPHVMSGEGMTTREYNSSELLACGRCGRDRMTPLEMEEHAKHCDILAKYRHMRRHSVPSYVMCPQCGMRFTDRSDYRKHYNYYHSNRPELYTCEYCNKKQAFTEKRHLQAHKLSEPVCHDCKKRYNKIGHLHLHQKNTNHDRERTRLVKSAKHLRPETSQPTVTQMYDVISRSPGSEVPAGYSFMSVKLDPIHRIPGAENRLVLVPQTASRQGYTLKAEFMNPPYPVPPINMRTQDEHGE